MSYVAIQTEAGSLLPSDGALAVIGAGTTQIVPANFNGATGNEGFIRFNILVGGSDLSGYGYETQERGFIDFNIFIDLGDGERRAYLIADHLEGLYGGKTSGLTVFSKSNITFKGIDTANPNLWRLDLRVPFIRFN